MIFFSVTFKLLLPEPVSVYYSSEEISVRTDKLIKTEQLGAGHVS